MNFLTIFVRPPGDLIYYMLIMAVMLAGLLMAAGHHMRRGSRSTARLTIGVGGAVTAWLLLMVGALISVVGSQDSFSSQQALERAVVLLMIISLGWAFITTDSPFLETWGNRTAIGLAVTVILLFVLTGSAVNEDGLAKASLPIVFIWLGAPILLLAGGIALLATQRDEINDTPLKMVFAAVMIAGYTAGLVQHIQSMPDSAIGSMRLAFAVALGVSIMILYRALMGGLVAQIRTLEQSAQRLPTVSVPSSPPRDRPAASPQRVVASGERESMQLLRALGLMIEDTKPEAIPSQLVRAALEMLRADIGALIRVQDANYADIVVGFDRSRKRAVNGLALNLNDQPTLKNAIERQQQRPLFPDRNQAELDDLYTRLNVEQTGPVYFQPLARDGHLNAVLLIGFPFSDRELTETEAEALKGLGVIAAGLLSLSDAAEDSRLLAEERAIQAMVQGVPLSQLSDEQVLNARQSAMAELQKSRGDVDILTRQVRQLEERISLERDRLAMTLGDTDADLSISQRVATVSQKQLLLRDERDKLAERVRQMESALSGAGPQTDDSALQNLITSLRQERDELVSQRQRLESQLHELRSASLNPDRESATAAMMSIDADHSNLEVARNQMQLKFERLQNQLEKFGVDGSPSGIAHLISQLYSERASLMGRITTLNSEKDTLVQERTKLNQRLAQLRDSEQQINQLQREINNVASDREAIVKQRDALKSQRDELVERFEAVRKFRERVVERIATLENQLKVNQERFTQFASGEAITESKGNAMMLELSKATTRIVELERELGSIHTSASKSGIRQLTDEESDTLTGLVQELRTPITSMRGYVDLMLKESVGILGDTQRKFLQRVAVNVGRLSNMIEDLVRVAALDAGRVNLGREEIDMVAVIEEAVTEVTMPLREKGIEISLELPELAPPVVGDREAMKQIALQLLTNAYLAAPPNSIIRVEVTVRDHPGKDGLAYSGVQFSVGDNGEGIAPEDTERVFQRRFHGENPLIPGLGDTGVGLAIAKSLTEMQNGQIWVDTRPNATTRINVLFGAL